MKQTVPYNVVFFQ